MRTLSITPLLTHGLRNIFALLLGCLKTRASRVVFRLNVDHTEFPVLAFFVCSHHPEEIYRTARSGNIRVIALRHEDNVAFADDLDQFGLPGVEIGRASCRERVKSAMGDS